MEKAYLFLAEGFEEVEALTVVDILRRGGVDCKTVSVTGDYDVISSHGVLICADLLFDGQPLDDAGMLILPGGIPGTPNLKAHTGLDKLIREYQAAGKYLAAVCAAPTVYGEKGLLEGKAATCYPGMEDGLVGAVKKTDAVVCDGQFITSRGMGTCIDFGLALLEKLTDEKTAKDIGKKIVYYQ
ncbi:MAG: DJ-1/PfpI family protein [Bacteroidales bacterium]|nr:DJ-1/PfpI family protein [Clostridium sp.]MCM1203217.1 DJ-1/PfpI family protein [Bacteroidales bacterium]